jgi:hypothetical protein
MADQPIVIKNYDKAETGENAKKLIDWESGEKGVRLTGYPEGLAKALVHMKMVPGAEGKDIPGSFDDWAEDGKSEPYLLQGWNVKGQPRQKRWYEFIEDKQDFPLGVLFDYFLSPAFNIAGYYLSGRNSNEDDANKFIDNLNKRYPIDPRWEREAALARYDYHGPEIEGLNLPKKPHEPSKDEKEAVRYQLKLPKAQYMKMMAEKGLINEEIKGMKEDSRRFKDFLKSSVV